MRKFARSVHIYTGLSLGIVLVVIALSGAVLVFYPAIDRLLNPDIQTTKALGPPNWDKILLNLRETFPEKTGPWRLELGDDPGFIPARYYNPVETQGKAFAPMMVWLSYDGERVLRHTFWGDYFVTWMYNLHYQLLLGKRGAIIVGYLGIATLFFLLSGLVTWWPRKHQWRKSLRVKPRAAWSRKLYDWHKWAGIAVLIPALILCVTGAMLALPKETNFILKSTLGDVRKPTFRDHSLNSLYNTRLLPLSIILAKARGYDSEATLAWIQTPPVQGGYYRLRLQVEGDPSRRFPHSYIELDAHTGAVTQAFDIRKQPAANKVKNWLHPLHDGSVFGLTGRIVWVVTGLGIIGLWITGMARWLLQRRPVKRKIFKPLIYNDK